MSRMNERAGRISRGVAGLLVALVVVQFYTAGLGVFGGASFRAHAIIGSLSALVSLLLLVTVALARRGWTVGFFALGCILLTILQPVLVFVVRPRLPVLAAMHPVIGLLIGVMAWHVASASRRNKTFVPALPSPPGRQPG